MITFFVAGRPVQQGSMRHVGRGRMIHSNHDGLMAWRALVAESAVSACGDWFAVKGVPVEVVVDFYLPRGKSVRRLLPTTAPDADKLARAVNDALTGAVMDDDAQVVAMTVRKHYADDVDAVGARIAIRAVHEDAA
jgi:Holliday junction resolvase RusA-like endonuclease